MVGAMRDVDQRAWPTATVVADAPVFEIPDGIPGLYNRLVGSIVMKVINIKTPNFEELKHLLGELRIGLARIVNPPDGTSYSAKYAVDAGQMYTAVKAAIDVIFDEGDPGKGTG